MNDVDTYVYEITPANITEEDAEGLEVSDVAGQLNIAKEGFYVVRLLLTGFGTGQELSGDPNLEGDLFYELNFTELTDPVTIAAPEDCSGTDPTSFAYPLLDDASNFVSLGAGLSSYESNASFEEAVEFYKTEMAAAGWNLDQEIVFSPDALLAFSMTDGKSVQISISSGDDVLTITIIDL